MRSLFHSTVLRRTLACSVLSCAGYAQADHAATFEKDILPILEKHCYDCHGDGEHKGKVSFDTFGTTEALIGQTDLWLHALKNLRSGMMPPAKKKRPTAQEISTLEAWIKLGPLKLDPLHPNPGRITLRRLNRVEYRNTIRDLTGVDFRTDEEFPADDTGYGFDTIADALTTSPLLLEKYMQAAETIVAKAVPLQGSVTPARSISAKNFTSKGAGDDRLSLHDPADLKITREDVPPERAEQVKYAEEIIRRFTTRAFRRPVDEPTIQKLTALATVFAASPGGSFECGIAKALTAVLASPRFLFRLEDTVPEADPAAHPLLDEFALASRLSYFLWSTMPDEPLYQLAERGELRKNLAAQVTRMLNHERSDELVQNFAGQWLQTRDVESVSIDARIVQARDIGQEKDMRGRFELRQRLNQAIDDAEKAHDTAQLEVLRQELADFRAKSGKRIEFSGSLRTAMRREAEMMFRHLLQDDRSLLELIENDSTFLNEELANHYGVPDVRGEEMRLVKLPPDSPRGGVITMGSVLAVTSNPTRTSPVKRGLFILENLLGTPPPPPPPNIPSLEASEKSHDGGNLTLRAALALHREQPLCSSCHNRMDPLGLALENFNAMGSWREKDQGIPLESPAGQLITGEKFADVRELKHLLVTTRRRDFYQCITEKLTTYALGRGPLPCDITTQDAIVEKLEQTNGKFSTLITGIIESPAFQQRQRLIP